MITTGVYSNIMHIQNVKAKSVFVSADALYRAKMFSAALSRLEPIQIADRDVFCKSYFLAGECYFALGRFPEAVEIYKNCIFVANNEWKQAAYGRLYEAYRVLGKPDEAAKYKAEASTILRDKR